MSKWLFSSFITLSVFLPSVAEACMPQNPYFYMVKGAFLLALLGFVLAIVLELFRYAVETAPARQILRRGALLFVLLSIVMLLVGCAYTALEQAWQTDYGTLPAGGTGQRC